ncbi:MAG: hypothetical protein ACKO6N_06755 [Myxococcota bacterium]
MNISEPSQVLSTLAALCVLAAYAGNTSGKIASTSLVHAALNTGGGLILAWSALSAGKAGLILIEVTWTLISLYALVRWLLARRNNQSPPLV